MWRWWDTSAGAWGLLAIGVGGGIVLSYVSSPQVGIPVGVAITLTGIFLVIRAYRSKAKSKESVADTLEKARITGRLEDVSRVESEFILAKSIELEAIHGYNDLLGLFADRASGVPLNELSTRPCSQCGIPRNQRGKHDE
jgi:hypothetical protein